MAVIIEDIRITPELGTGETNFLLGNIGDKITIEIDVEVSENVIATAQADSGSPYLLQDGGRQIRIRPLPEQSDEVDNDDLIWSSDPSAFQNFRVNDVIIIVGSRQEVSGTVGGSDGNYIITEKIGNQKIRVVPDGAFALQPLSYILINNNIALFTPVQGVSYSYNFIENEDTETFNSLIDGELQNLKTNSANANDLVTQVPMTFNGKKSYQIGDASIIGRGVTVFGGQLFTITHNTFITPFFLAHQLNDLQNLIQPSYLVNEKSLSYAIGLEAGRSIFDQNTMQSSEGYSRLTGNTGWFNENFNGRPTNYSISAFNYEKVVGAVPVSSIQLTEETKLTVTIENVTDAPFVDANTQLVANVVYLPNVDSEYIKNGNTQAENYFFDRSLNTLGSTTAGDNFGTDFQMIKEVTSVFNTTDEIEVQIFFDIASVAQAELASRPETNVIVFISIQDHTTTVDNSDKVSLLVEPSELEVVLTEADLITNDTSFLQHYTNVDTIKTFCAFPVDDIIAKSVFSIDFTGRETEGIKILEVQNRINLVHATEDDIVLEEFVSNVSNSPLNGLGQYINESVERQFVLDSGNIRKKISITSDTPVGNVHTWNVSFPFIKRFEYWQSLLLNTLPNGLFDPLEPNDGLNHDWFRLASQAGWSLSYQLRFIIEQNGEQFEQSFDCPIDSVDFESNADWSNELIETFDEAGSTNLNNIILGYEKTRIKANFEWSGATAPNLSDVDMVIWLNTYEQGGINTIFKASSVYDIDSVSVFESVDASNKVVVSESAGVFTGEVLVDNTKLPEAECFTLYARIYDKRTTPATAKLLENGEVKLMEDGEIKIIE